MSKKSTDAKSYEKIGKRLSTSRLQTGGLSNDASAHLEVIKDDMYESLRTELDKEGHTGKLGSPDGLDEKHQTHYKDFFIQRFRQVYFVSELDVFGIPRYYAYGMKETLLNGKKVTANFGSPKMGFATEREAMKEVITAIDAYYKGGGK